MRAGQASSLMEAAALGFNEPLTLDPLLATLSKDLATHASIRTLSNNPLLQQRWFQYETFAAARGPERVFILREAYTSTFDNLAMLWSMGKDSTVLLVVGEKSLFRACPFPSDSHRHQL